MASRTENYLAFDLGASSGRAILGRLDGERLSLETLHRFTNGPVDLLGTLYWDILGLFQEIVRGLQRYQGEYGDDLTAIGLDTWGVDYALLDRNDQLLANPRHYRDPRTEGMMALACERLSRQEIFERTGIQFIEINTLYQLLAMREGGDPTLDSAHTMLMIPDLLNYWLTGVKGCEFSVATTTQFYDPRRGDWARALLESLHLPTDMLQPIVPSGTDLGPLSEHVAEEVGLGDVSVITPACHDTGSAVAAVPAEDEHFAYISSGTWSLMGVEIDEPIINEESLAFNLTNEGGVGGTFRLLKNIMGLWLVQECRREWARDGQTLSYDEITHLASKAPAFGPLLEPDSSDFLRPGDMSDRIRDFCRRTGQSAPQSKGEVIRCALESLALKYRWTFERLEQLLGRRLNVLHVVGGGTQNQLLCQLTADALDRPVVTGPVEATAVGNLLVQAMAKGRLDTLADVRQVVRNSFELGRYEPRPDTRWDEAYQRFLNLRERLGVEG